MPTPLPARPSLDWLRKRAKLHLKSLRRTRPSAQLAEAQFALARSYGLPSWRKLKEHVERLRAVAEPAVPLPEELVAGFLARVGAGEAELVAAALRQWPALVNAVGPHPYWGGRPQALHVAIETRRPDMVALLLKHGADVNGRNDEYLHWSPLLLTFHWDQGRVRRMLLRRGARVGLVEAMAMADDRRVLRLLRQGRRALPSEAPNGGSLLMFARTPRTVDRLLELGVPLDLKDRWGATPLEAFSRMGPKGRPLVAHLMTRGVRAEIEMFARMNDRRRIADLLGKTPELIRRPALLKAAVDFGHLGLAKWLLARGADPNGQAGGEADETPLHSAAWNGNRRMVDLLLAHGADPTLTDRQYGGTPAGWAETAVEVTNNPKCTPIGALLRGAEQPPA